MCVPTYEFIDEVNLTFACYLRGVACAYLSIHAEYVLLHSKQALLYILLVGLVQFLTIRAKVVVITQPLKQALFANRIAVLGNHLRKLTNQA